MGVDTYRTKVIAFTLCALLGGLGGGLFASGFTYISPDQFGFAESVVFLTMALLGGVRSPLGATLGTALLILLPEFRWKNALKQPTRNTVAKKRAGLEDVDSDYLSGNFFHSFDSMAGR